MNHPRGVNRLGLVVLFGLTLLLAAPAPFSSGRDAAEPRARVTVDVRRVGAVGDGIADDTDAIQRANDIVARRGGGDVVFPRGTYVASGIEQDSHVTFRGDNGAVLRHPDGVSAAPIIASRVRAARGDVLRGSREVTLDDPMDVPPGSVVGVQGAGGPSSKQTTRLAGAITSTADTLDVTGLDGFTQPHPDEPNFVVVDHEVMSYRNIVGNRFVGLRRGMLGTYAAAHETGEVVAQLLVLQTSGSSRGSLLVLDEAARFTVRHAVVWAGAIGVSVRDLTLDGNRQPSGSLLTNPFPIAYAMTRDASVVGCTIRNGDHGALILDRGAERSVIEDNTLEDNGDLGHELGAAIWVFRGAHDNVIRDNKIGGRSVSGVIVDDRTVMPTEWDSPSDGNRIERNEIDLDPMHNNVGIAIYGSSRNLVTSNHLSGGAFGVRVYTGGQGSAAPATTANVVSDNLVSYDRIALWANGARNRFSGNVLVGSRREAVDAGTHNLFG